MIFSYINHDHKPRLIIIFAGWSMDARPLRHLSHPDCDVAVIYDYTDTGLNLPADIWDYSEISVMAWSFGVVPAALFITGHPALPITVKTAINGTHYPVDDTRGIPEAIFQGTSANLSEETLTKFYRRMCGSSTAYREWEINKPERRDINALADELQAIASLPHIDEREVLWDRVIISESDRIIPTANQLRAWSGHHGIQLVTGSHLPDFQWIINSTITDKPLVADRFRRAAGSYDENASVQRHAAARLASLWSATSGSTDIESLLEIGAGTGLFTREYLRYVNPKRLTLWDLAEISAELPGTHRICDAETAIMDIPSGCMDAIVSASTIQWFNSPATFMRHCRRVLKPGGTLALSTFGPENFKELGPTTSSALQYLSCESWLDILPQGFEPLNISEESITLTFGSPEELLRHISLTGVNATGNRHPLTAVRSILKSGLRTLTYRPVYIIARKS